MPRLPSLLLLLLFALGLCGTALADERRDDLALRPEPAETTSQPDLAPEARSPAGTAAASEGPVAPYILAGTEVRSVRAKALGRDYQIFVSLPASYQTGRRRYPVLFVTDADYAFPLIRSIAQRVGKGGQSLEDFILVGLSYAVDEAPLFSRRRDYTPTPNGERKAPSGMPGRAPEFGGAEAYRKFLAEELMPFVAATYRTDTTRSIYAGHSYGGLLGVHILLTEPDMFSHYILGSPSLWFDQRVMLEREKAYADANKDMKAHVFMAIGSFETVNRESDNPRFDRKTDMVADFRAFEQALRSRGYPGLKLTTEVVGDEDHLTVFPSIITRGLLWAVPARRP